MYYYEPPHIAEQKQDIHLEHTYSSYVRVRDVALKSCQQRSMIGRSGKRGSGISVLAARHDDGEGVYNPDWLKLAWNLGWWLKGPRDPDWISKGAWNPDWWKKRSASGLMIKRSSTSGLIITWISEFKFIIERFLEFRLISKRTLDSTLIIKW